MSCIPRVALKWAEGARRLSRQAGPGCPCGSNGGRFQGFCGFGAPWCVFKLGVAENEIGDRASFEPITPGIQQGWRPPFHPGVVSARHRSWSGDAPSWTDRTTTTRPAWQRDARIDRWSSGFLCVRSWAGTQARREARVRPSRRLPRERTELQSPDPGCSAGASGCEATQLLVLTRLPSLGRRPRHAMWPCAPFIAIAFPAPINYLDSLSAVAVLCVCVFGPDCWQSDAGRAEVARPQVQAEPLCWSISQVSSSHMSKEKEPHF